MKKDANHPHYWLQQALLRIIESDADADYTRRNELIYRALAYATLLSIPCGIRIDPQEPQWPVAFIELTTGQVSWHLPEHETPWDGHTTDEKTRRVQEFAQCQSPAGSTRASS